MIASVQSLAGHEWQRSAADVAECGIEIRGRHNQPPDAHSPFLQDKDRPATVVLRPAYVVDVDRRQFFRFFYTGRFRYSFPPELHHGALSSQRTSPKHGRYHEVTGRGSHNLLKNNNYSLSFVRIKTVRRTCCSWSNERRSTKWSQCPRWTIRGYSRGPYQQLVRSGRDEYGQEGAGNPRRLRSFLPRSAGPAQLTDWGGVDGQTQISASQSAS